MIIDYADSLTALTGLAPAGCLTALPDEGVTAEDRFVLALWRACGHEGTAFRVASDATGGLPGPGWSACLVGGNVGMSQFTALRDLTAVGPALPGPVACLALGGAGLQGQHGRRWQAAPGNLHLSVAMPCNLHAARCGPSLPMLPGVALAEAAADLLGPETAARVGLGLKWVNDLVVGDGAGSWRKLGGVLTAMRTSGARVTTVFCGLALNLEVAPALAPDPFALPPGALADIAPAADLPRPLLAGAVAAVLARLRERLAALEAQGPDGLVEAYRARSVIVGREVAVWDAAAREPGASAGSAPRRRGIVAAIRPDLGLELEGQDEPVRDGCLRLVESQANR